MVPSWYNPWSTTSSCYWLKSSSSITIMSTSDTTVYSSITSVMLCPKLKWKHSTCDHLSPPPPSNMIVPPIIITERTTFTVPCSYQRCHPTLNSSQRAHSNWRQEPDQGSKTVNPPGWRYSLQHHSANRCSSHFRFQLSFIFTIRLMSSSNTTFHLQQLFTSNIQQQK